MYKGAKIGVIITSAGTSSRMGTKTPKQFMVIKGEPVVAKAYKAFAACDMIDKIFVVTAEEMMQECKNKMVPYIPSEYLAKLGGIVSGGKERQDSVFHGIYALKKSNPEIEYILIHDAARPFVTKKIIEDTVEAVYEHKAAIVCVKPKDTIRTAEDTLARDSLYIVQTPQAFRSDILIKAYEKAYKDGYYGTDDAGLVERIGIKPALVEGDYRNIKITTREDMPTETRIGHGFDVHRLVRGRKCIIGGVDIPSEVGLLGHSDADVLLHAIADAILGAAGIGDIGEHFPDSDDTYKDADSLELLLQAYGLAKQQGYVVSNIDATVICEKPKLAPYKGKMQKNIAAVLGVAATQVNIKATTTEKLGFTGRSEGIAAEAVCILNTK